MSSAGRRLILASASPRRRELLSGLGVKFEVEPCRVPEPVSKPDDLSPAAWAEALACFKAAAVAQRRPGQWVLGADTVVVCAGQLLGKPADVEDARRMLELQAGRPADVITGLCLTCRDEGTRLVSHCRTRVWMRDDRQQREAYLASGAWRGKAGAYGLQDVPDRLVAQVEGSRSNVVGLPLELTARLLRRVGFLPPAVGATRSPAWT